MPKILIADDEQNILMLLDIMLKDLGYEVISAENGEIAIEKAKKEQPDLIISDIVMPIKNGFELCRAVRSDPSISDTPIILLSALGDDYNKLTGFDEGADDYMTKPFNVEELKVRAQTLLLRHQSKKQKESPEKTPINAVNASFTTTEQSAPLSTGIELLDAHLDGGIPKGSNILLTGPLGKGKSSFARKFISDGLRQHDPSLWVALDDDPSKIRYELNQQLPLTTADYEQQDLLRFVDAYSWSSLSPPENERFAINGVLGLNQLSGIISDASQELGQSIQSKLGGRRVLDSLSSLLINFDLSSVQRFVNQIARTATAFGGVTTLFLLEEGTITEQVQNNIKYVMDGVIEFQGHDNQRQMRVSSMKWSQYNNEWIAITNETFSTNY